MAIRLGMEEKTYQRLERGENFPKEETLRHISEKLGISEVTLFQYNDDASPLAAAVSLILPALNEAQLNNLLSTAKLFREVNALALGKVDHLPKDKG